MLHITESRVDGCSILEDELRIIRARNHPHGPTCCCTRRSTCILHAHQQHARYRRVAQSCLHGWSQTHTHTAGRSTRVQGFFLGSPDTVFDRCKWSLPLCGPGAASCCSVPGLCPMPCQTQVPQVSLPMLTDRPYSYNLPPYLLPRLTLAPAQTYACLAQNGSHVVQPCRP